MSYTILIVDDEENFRNNVDDHLSPLGYEVLGAANLEEAKRFINRGDGDVSGT